MSRLRPVQLLVLLLLVLGSVGGWAQARMDCSALDSRILHAKVRYCVLLPNGYQANGAVRYPILYFLHGLGDNERSLINMGAWNVVDNLRRQGKIGDYLIVTPEAGRSFYVNSADGRYRYSDFFLQEFMPAIEHKYRVKPGRASRAISGISMGGYGAFRFAFSRPELFSAVSAESAALIADPPAKLNAGIRSGIPIAQVLREPFGNPIDAQHWRENDPFALARRNVGAIRGMEIQFNCGREDDYGFEVGAEALDRQLTGEGIRHTFQIYPGGHTLTYFLTHLGEILEFHWRAFAAAGGAKASSH